ncbi:MAG: hypothetical protein IJ943_07890 [Akkermansia sp.]|nr:hypothetical protein [Akkermansia sp.]
MQSEKLFFPKNAFFAEQIGARYFTGLRYTDLAGFMVSRNMALVLPEGAPQQAELQDQMRQ